jgi:exosortase
VEGRDAPASGPDEHAHRSSNDRLTLAAVSGLVLAVGALYGPVLLKLWRDWQSDEGYSHGVLVAPIAALLVWRQRDRLRRLPRRPSSGGLAIVIASLMLFAAGSLAAELFSTRLSLIGLLAGTIVYVFGWKHLRVAAFPVSFLVFMIPLPALVLDRMTQSLQLIASGMGEQLLRAAAIPVLRDGNVLTLPTITLNVTDACSGVRSLVALLAITSLVAYLDEPTTASAAALTLSAVPLAIGLNGVRIAFTGLAAARFGPQVAQGFIHEASGWAMFVVAFLLIWLLHRVMRAARPRFGTTLEHA